MSKRHNNALYTNRCTLFKMTLLPHRFYYVDKTILDLIQNGFELVNKKEWYKLYVNKLDNSFLRFLGVTGFR